MTNPDGSYLEITYIRQPGNSQLQRLPSLVPGAAVDMQSINQFGVVAGAAYVDTSMTWNTHSCTPRVRFST